MEEILRARHGETVQSFHVTASTELLSPNFYLFTNGEVLSSLSFAVFVEAWLVK